MAAQRSSLSTEVQKTKGSTSWKRLGLLFVMTLGLVGAGYWWNSIKTYHFLEVKPGVLYRDGNQGLREFSTAVRNSGVKTVVALVDENEWKDPNKKQFADEEAFLRQQGVKLERIPIKLGGWPTSDDVAMFLKIANDPANQPVLVHCAQGVRRTGMMVAAWQESALQYDDKKAEAAIEAFGHSERTIGDVRRFIQGYDPATGAVPEGLTDSKE